MALEHAIRFPCLTVGSGPANSMRGSAHISGLTDAIVADIGGTTTDVGLLVNGFPWESTLPNAVGDVDTNFRLPDIVTVPIGGGCVVRRKTDRWTVDVRSLGHALVQEALCFGGFTPTLTDAAVAAGRARIGDRPVPAEWAARLSSALAYSDRLLADAIERVRLGPDDLPLVIVGGGSIIAPATFPGIRRVVRPPHAEVANAIGAAIAPVGGQAERICANRPDRRADAVADISSEAIHRAIHAGADPALVRVVEVDEVPLTYLLDPAVRIKVRAVGPLAGFTRTGASRHERKQPPGTGPGPLPHTEAGVRPKEATR
jgi:N-methylhydantoinase A/oxoprolinase/acetone carboxylase beta subunit